MNIIRTKILGIFILFPTVFDEADGFTMESWSQRNLIMAGIKTNFVQEHFITCDTIGKIYGISFQKGEYAQSRLLHVVRGKIKVIAVDFRKNSPTYKKWMSFTLSDYNKQQVLLPRGVGYGFVTLEDHVGIIEKVDQYDAPTEIQKVRWNDPDMGIDWGVEEPVIAEEFQESPFFKDIEDDIQF